MNDMDERMEELLPFYALGGLTDEERAQVEAYVAANPAAKSRLDEMMRTSSAISYAVAPVEPSPELKRSLMSRVNREARARTSRRVDADSAPRFSLSQLFNNLLPRLSPALILLSLVATTAVGAWAISLNNEVARLRSETQTLQAELATQREVVAQLAAPGAQVVVISGTEHQPGAYGQLVADRNGQSAVLIVSGLPPLEPGKVYQLWVIRGDTPVSAGLFEVDKSGVVILRVIADVTPGSFNAIGVSVEPAGGSQLPTGDIVMLGKSS